MSYCDKIILCPHCGKPMKELTGKGRLRRDVYYTGDEDSWGYSAKEAVPTWVCEECGIKHVEYYKGWNCGYGDEWIFPKGYEKTITPKQESYIRNLCAHNTFIAREEDKDFWSVPYITNIELASKWISEHVAAGEKLHAEDSMRNRVVNSLDSIGWHEHNAWNHYHGQDKTEFSEKKTDDLIHDGGQIEFCSYLQIDWTTREITSKILVSTNLDTEDQHAKLARFLKEHDRKTEIAKNVIKESWK